MSGRSGLVGAAAETIFADIAIPAKRLEARREMVTPEPSVHAFSRESAIVAGQLPPMFGSVALYMVDGEKCGNLSAAAHARLTVVVENVLPQREITPTSYRRDASAASDGGGFAKLLRAQGLFTLSTSTKSFWRWQSIPPSWHPTITATLFRSVFSCAVQTWAAALRLFSGGTEIIQQAIYAALRAPAVSFGSVAVDLFRYVAPSAPRIVVSAHARRAVTRRTILRWSREKFRSQLEHSAFRAPSGSVRPNWSSAHINILSHLVAHGQF